MNFPNCVECRVPCGVKKLKESVNRLIYYSSYNNQISRIVWNVGSPFNKVLGRVKSRKKVRARRNSEAHDCTIDHCSIFSACLSRASTFPACSNRKVLCIPLYPPCQHIAGNQKIVIDSRSGAADTYNIMHCIPLCQ